MIESEALKNEWHVVYRSKDLADGDVRPIRLLGQDLVLWRSRGRAVAWLDLCIHRGTALSLGWVADDCLVCPYHAWRFDSSGACVRIPQSATTTPTAREQRPPRRRRAARARRWIG